MNPFAAWLGRVLAVLAGLAGAPALAEPGGASGATGWRDREQLTGDWGGLRTTLAECGLAFRADYTAGFWSNLRGGFETGTEYEGFATWGVDLDLERAIGWKGAEIVTSWYSYHGGQPSETLVGPFPTQTVSGNEASESVRFFELYLQQAWSDGRFALKGGQLAADNDFFVSEYAAVFENGSFGLRGVGRNSQTAPFFPLAAPGGHLRARTRDQHWEAQFGAYSADAGEDTENNLGFDSGFDDGAFLIGELAASRAPFGLAGKYTIGFAGTTAAGRAFDGSRVHGSYGMYLQVDQTLVAESAERPGLGLFVRAYGAPQQDRNLVSWYADFGLVLTRPFRARPDDAIGLGFAHLRFGDDYVDFSRAQGQDVSRRESLLELTYRFQLTGWLTLQPDLQFFFDPHFSRADATVIGLRAVIRL